MRTHSGGIAALVVMAGLAAAAPARASGGFLPPVKMDFGRVTSVEHGAARAGDQLMVGLNWATIYPHETRFDVGIGFMNVWLDAPTLATGLARSTTTAPDPGMQSAATGGYLEVSELVAGGRHWRTWASQRAELLSMDGGRGVGGAVRVTTEVWAGVLAGGNGAGIIGVASLGLWAEAGARGLPDGSRADVIATGLTLRLPLVVAGH